MALSFEYPKLNGFMMGNFFPALGGTSIFVPAFSIANAFPQYAGSIVALVTGAFDASAVVFLFYQLLYKASHGSFTPTRFFFYYLIVPLLILIVQLTLMPRRGYETKAELERDLVAARDATTDVHDSDDEIDNDTELRRVRSSRANVVAKRSATSTEFWATPTRGRRR